MQRPVSCQSGHARPTNRDTAGRMPAASCSRQPAKWRISVPDCPWHAVGMGATLTLGQALHARHTQGSEGSAGSMLACVLCLAVTLVGVVAVVVQLFPRPLAQ